MTTKSSWRVLSPPQRRGSQWVSHSKRHRSNRKIRKLPRGTIRALSFFLLSLSSLRHKEASAEEREVYVKIGVAMATEVWQMFFKICFFPEQKTCLFSILLWNFTTSDFWIAFRPRALYVFLRSQPSVPRCVVWSWCLKEYFALTSAVLKGLWKRPWPFRGRRLYQADEPALIRAKQRYKAANAWAVWLCACARRWPGSGLMSVCNLHCFKFVLERFSLDCRKTKTKVNTLANQRA